MFQADQLRFSYVIELIVVRTSEIVSRTGVGRGQTWRISPVASKLDWEVYMASNSLVAVQEAQTNRQSSFAPVIPFQDVHTRIDAAGFGRSYCLCCTVPSYRAVSLSIELQSVN